MSNANEYPTTFVDEAQPLPAYIDQAVLNERGLYVVNGLTRPLARQLSKRSLEEAVADFCFNDYLRDKGEPTERPGRFMDLEAATAWQAKGREVFLLVKQLGGSALENADEDLVPEDNGLRNMGIIWLGPEKPGKKEPQLEGAEITFAMRIFEGASGKGNALPFIMAALAAHDQIHGNEGQWLEAWGDNPSALRTYEKAGFEEKARMKGIRHGQQKDRVYMQRDLALGKLTA